MNNITVDITEIPFEDFKPNSVVAILPKDVNVVVLPVEMKIELLTEAFMNEAGWYRLNLPTLPSLAPITPQSK